MSDAQADHQLLTAAAGGDRGAFAILVERYQGPVFHLARALTGDRVAAEDVLQDTFLAAWRGAAGFRGDGAVGAWLYAIARHAAARRGRRADQVATDDRSLEQLGAAAGWGATDVAAAAHQAEDRAALERALATLSADDRTAIWMHHVLDQTFEDTARVLGCSVAAVKSRLHRARLALAAALREGGHHDAR